jgi:hypothetical protein
MVDKLRTRFTNWDYTRTVAIPEYVVPTCPKSLNENIEEIGTEIFRKR